MMLMGIICWIVLGILAGFLASKVVTGHGKPDSPAKRTQRDTVVTIAEPRR